MRRTVLLLLCGASLAARAAPAQLAVAPATEGEVATGGSIGLEEALRRSVHHNPEIARLDAALADKLGRAVAAQVKLNPAFKVTAGRTSERDGVGSALEFEIEQPLRPSDFGLRRLYGEALRAAATLEQQADVLRVLNGTAINYYRAWALQERAALLTGARGDADALLATIERQLEAGQSNVSERSIFKAESAQFSAELLAVRGEQAAARADLERATGLPLTNLRLLRPRFDALPSREALVEFAESRSGIRRLALAQRAAAARAVSVARADAVFPEFAPGLITSYGSRNDDAVVGFTIAGRLPIWDRNQAEVTRARGALAAADRELASFDRVSLGRLIDARRQQLLNLEARVVAYREKVIPAYRSAYEGTLAQFRDGQATTLQIFEVQRSLMEAQEKLFAHAVEALSARTHLEQLIGGRLEEVGAAQSRRGPDRSK